MIKVDRIHPHVHKSEILGVFPNRANRERPSNKRNHGCGILEPKRK
jgi:hypothetical protein